ncbi:hypothetical protein SESBI_40524 [Sesbania bispinosa]|nr:hypothetical protein SESBI_40524 [Sesbania bispinosa]
MAEKIQAYNPIKINLIKLTQDDYFINRGIELNSEQYGKNQMEEPKDVNQIGQKPEEGPPLLLYGSGDMTDASFMMKGKNSKSMKKEHRSLKEEIRVFQLETLQGGNAHTDEEHATFGEKIYLKDHCKEKPARSDVQRCPGELEIGRRCFLVKSNFGKQELSSIKQRIFLVQVFELHTDKVVNLISKSEKTTTAESNAVGKIPRVNNMQRP